MPDFSAVAAATASAAAAADPELTGLDAIVGVTLLLPNSCFAFLFLPVLVREQQLGFCFLSPLPLMKTELSSLQSAQQRERERERGKECR